MALGFESPSNRNEYQGYFLGGKGDLWVRLITHHLHTEIWEPQTPGTLWACPGM